MNNKSILEYNAAALVVAILNKDVSIPVGEIYGAKKDNVYGKIREYREKKGSVSK